MTKIAGRLRPSAQTETVPDQAILTSPRTILLTGATGYVGARLLPLLEQRGERVRCLSRSPEKLQHSVGRSTEVVKGDLNDEPSLREALKDVQVAYYLVHGMGGTGDFAERDREAARDFLKVAEDAGVQKIIYVGGLGDEREALSPHLRSRQEVGRILRSGQVTTIELRAAVILGSGSLSFQLVRTLAHRLPVMVTPKWVETETQPIAITDVLDYLLAALEHDPGSSRVYEIGGSDVTTYGGMIREYSRQCGLKRLMIPVPVLSPYLSGLWLGLVTPANASVGRHLVEGLKNPTIVTNDDARRAMPNVQPISTSEAIRRAIAESKAKR